ncbi:MAG TPA: tripartite tricarboxylate transporter substrate-binding protein, partial [Thermodesulfobacteriota bacterium]|nr:tripartite tricarboxylate transporter substrate-binding protein [Thermodesulfobacteriota bacterium]
MKVGALIVLVAGAVLCLSGAVLAQDYPNKPITLQVPYPAGGSTDVGARIAAAFAEKELGKPIVVVNKAGAGGQIGWTELARQKPDGYYLGYINLPHLPSAILDPERKATFKGED